MKRKLKILVATQNPGKIKAISLGLDKFFEDYEIMGIKVNSGVANQPVNKEIFKGAKTRCQNLKKYAEEENIEADYYIAVEGGITNLLGPWVNLNLVYIEDNKGLAASATSQGYPFPERYLKEIKEKEFGKVMDEHYGLTNSGQGDSVEYLFSKGNLSRIDLVKDATILALTRFINKDIW